MCIVSQYGLGAWEGSLITKGGPALMSQEGRHLIFILNMDILRAIKYQRTETVDLLRKHGGKTGIDKHR